MSTRTKVTAISAALVLGVIMTAAGVRLGRVGRADETAAGSDETTTETAGTPESSETPEDSPPEIVWRDGFEAALETAKQEGKPVFIDFHAAWCGYCKVLKQKTYPDPRIREALAKFVTVEVDVDDHPDLGKKYGAPPVPTLVAADATGETIGRVQGFRPPEGLIPLLEFALARHKLDANPDDAEAAYTAAVRSGQANLSPGERIQLVDKAIGDIEEDEKEKRAKLRLVRGVARAEAAAGDEEKLADAREDLKKAAELDPKNAGGVKEAADWMLIQIGGTGSTGLASVKRQVKQYLASYPAGEIHEEAIRLRALLVLAQLQERAQEYAEAAGTLRQFEDEAGARIDAKKLHRKIDQLEKQAGTDEDEAAEGSGPEDRPGEAAEDAQ